MTRWLRGSTAEGLVGLWEARSAQVTALPIINKEDIHPDTIQTTSRLAIIKAHTKELIQEDTTKVRF